MMKTILLIEDDLDISDVTNIFLSSKGYKVAHYFGIHNYEEYSKIIREVKPDLIIGIASLEELFPVELRE